MFTSPSSGLDIFPEPLIITDDCFQLSVSSTKSNHVTSLSAGLYPTEDYLHLINPGDWMFAWMVQSKEKFNQLIDDIKAFKQCNRFEDGLKFFGKVSNIRKQIIQNPNGPRLARYSLTGNGFTELDAQLYYNPYLKANQDYLATMFGRFGYDINDLVEGGRGGITSERAIPQIVDVMLGRGTPKNIRQNNPEGLNTTAGTEGDAAYILPRETGKLLGKDISTKRGGIGYSDLLELVVGVQEYDSSPGLVSVYKSFQPVGTEEPGSRRFTNNQSLLGAFLPTAPAFTNKTIWNILREFLNTACNEMYTSLRVNGSGEVVPTLVVRQLPFTSQLANLNIPSTKFLSLPRWNIDPVLIKSIDIGRSDAMRWNFVEVLPISSAYGARTPPALTATFPPIADTADIARHGLRPYMVTVPAYPGDTRSDTTSDWKDLINDVLMGQHMTLTGQMITYGIQSPICIGDNISFDGVVYHIESLNHTCSINETGVKSFITSIGLTHGVNESQDQNTDLSIYAHTSPFDAESNQFDPQTNADSTEERPKQEQRSLSVSEVNNIVSGTDDKVLT